MNSIEEYATSIIAMALISSILSGLVQNSEGKGFVRMICGMVMTLTVVAPIWSIDLSVLEGYYPGVLAAASAAAEEGEAISREALYACIKQETETYIQDKAAELSADVSVEVRLNDGDPPIPVGAVISGRVTPYAKHRLQKILDTQLGIAKENLEWTG